MLLGVATPSDLIKDRARTPFNVGHAIALQEFSRQEAGVLQAGLEARFESRLLPLFKRRTEAVGRLLPELYLHGLSTGDFDLALRGLLGDGPAVLSCAGHALFVDDAPRFNRLLAEFAAGVPGFRR